MESWEQFLNETSSGDVEAIEDFVGCIKSLAKKYNRTTLEKLWTKITSDKGDGLVREIIRNPSKSSSDFRKLATGK